MTTLIQSDGCKSQMILAIDKSNVRNRYFSDFINIKKVIEPTFSQHTTQKHNMYKHGNIKT